MLTNMYRTRRNKSEGLHHNKFRWLATLINSKSLLFTLVVVIIIIINANQMSALAQSVGYHTNLNLGFNPYLSPVFGYGIGLPYGAFGWSPMKSPMLLGSLFGAEFGGNSVLSKVHAKSILKKIGSPYQLYNRSFKNKLALLKYPEYAFTPYGSDYGYGKHYGSAVLPNNPYKSVYADYYNNIPTSNKPSTIDPLSQTYPESGGYAQSSNIDAVVKHYKIAKPLIKVGALLATAAILGKKSLESPVRLNPSGMILDGRYP